MIITINANDNVIIDKNKDDLLQGILYYFHLILDQLNMQISIGFIESYKMQAFHQEEFYGKSYET